MLTLSEFSKRLEMSLGRAQEILKDLFEFVDLDKGLTDEMIEVLQQIDEDKEKYNELKEKRLKEEEKKKKKETKSAKKPEKESKKKDKEEEKKTEEKTRTIKKRKVKGEVDISIEQETVSGEEETKSKAKRTTKKKEETEKQEKQKSSSRKKKAEEKSSVQTLLETKEEENIQEQENKEHLEKVKVAGTVLKEKIEEKKEGREQKLEPSIEHHKPPHIAEIIPEEEISKKSSIEESKKKKKTKEQGIGISIGGAVEDVEPVVEIVLSDGTRARIDDVDIERLMVQQKEEEISEEPELLEEDYGDELDWRKKHKKLMKHPPVPDPDIVAKVKRESEERLRKKKEKNKPKNVVVIDKDKLFGKKDERKGKIDKKDKKKGKYNKYAIEMDDETMLKEAAAAVKEFETFGSSIHLKKKKKRKDRTTPFDEVKKVEIPVIEVSGPMTVENVAQLLEVSPSDIIMDLMDLNIMANKNQLIDLDTIRFVTKKYGVEVKLVIPEEEEVLIEEPDNQEDLVPRAPVITVMGHVDHGKTSLLDRVRSTNVVATESGGITQHIAAYEVQTTGGKVVFLDTPGHEAFTQMRARGAKITDIVVLVVAADDGIQPQTIEAIDHAKAAEVPILVAINKCDKPDAQPDRVRQELIAYDLVDEAWGGKTIMKNISAKTGEGVSELLELIILQSQMMELKANPKKRARGSVIEAEISRGFGPVAWVLVQNGTLKVGDVTLVGNTWGRIRAMFNSQQEPIREAYPSTPVLISGLESLPEAGDTFVVVEDERKARLIAEKRQQIKKFQTGEPVKVITLEDFHSFVEAGEQKKLHILIKADVQGSADVLKSSLSGLGNEQVGVEIIRAGVGEVNESDILLAQVSKAIIITFHVGVNPRAQKLAEETGVEIRKYEVIYDIIEDVRKALSGLLKPIVNEVVVGHAEIRKVFRSSTFGNIAGCFQLDGTTVRGLWARIIRNGNVICEDRINTLKRNKDDVREVSAGFECGIKLEKFEDIKEGDIIEVYRLEEVRPSLN